jgi:hypothetical protein
MNEPIVIIFISLYIIMDNTAYLNLIGQTASAVASAGWLMYKMKKSKSNERCFIVLIQRRCGLSHQLNLLKETISHNCVVASLEDAVASSYETVEKMSFLKQHNHLIYENESKPLLKSYIQKLLKIHSRKVVILFTSDPSLVDYLKVNPKRVSILLPTLEFNRTLLSTYDKEDDKHIIQTSRETLLVETADKKYPRFLFRSYQQLEGILERLICPIK